MNHLLEHGDAILSRLSGKVVGAEIGVFRGRLSSFLLKNLPDLELFMVDCWMVHPRNSDYALSDDYVGNLTVAEIEEARYQAEFLTRFASTRRKIIHAPSLQAVQQVADASLDFAFIDADHTFFAAYDDMEAWLPKMKKNGIIAGHDIDFPNKPKWNVREAVEAFSAKIGKPFEVDRGYTWFIRL